MQLCSFIGKMKIRYIEIKAVKQVSGKVFSGNQKGSDKCDFNFYVYKGISSHRLWIEYIVEQHKNENKLYLVTETEFEIFVEPDNSEPIPTTEHERWFFADMTQMALSHTRIICSEVCVNTVFEGFILPLKPIMILEPEVAKSTWNVRIPDSR